MTPESGNPDRPMHERDLVVKQVARLDALSPLDGRYGRKTEELAEIFSERGLMQARVGVEIDYLIALSEDPHVPLRGFNEAERSLLEGLRTLTLEDAALIKAIETQGFGEDIERPTNHDVKSVEYYIKHRLAGTTLQPELEWVHFALTSEDVNNLAYAEMLQRGVSDVVIPAADALVEDLDAWATLYADNPMLARTHGQAASPTTFGKEMRVFAERLKKQIAKVHDMQIEAKLNGATGNYSAHDAGVPEVDWVAFTEQFIQERQSKHYRNPAVVPNHVTTQIEPHDSYVELFHGLQRLNSIIIDAAQDLWRYISDDWVKLRAVQGEKGSSAMSYKVNPIDAENAEGNAGKANADFEFFARKLPVSRLQRDLSDSTVERNFGSALGHTVIAIDSMRRAISKCALNGAAAEAALQANPKVVTEAYNAAMRAAGFAKPYEQLELLTRGKHVTLEQLREFVGNLDIDPRIKVDLIGIAPHTYTGYAARIARLDGIPGH